MSQVVETFVRCLIAGELIVVLALSCAALGKYLGTRS